MRTAEGLSFSPFLPEGWDSCSFRFVYRGRVIRLEMLRGGVKLSLISGGALTVKVWGEEHLLADELSLKRGKT